MDVPKRPAADVLRTYRLPTPKPFTPTIHTERNSARVPGGK